MNSTRGAVNVWIIKAISILQNTLTFIITSVGSGVAGEEAWGESATVPGRRAN